MRPDFREIKDIVAELLRLLWCHRLLVATRVSRHEGGATFAYDKNRPGRVLLLLDGPEEVLSGIIGILSGELSGLFIVESLKGTSFRMIDRGASGVTLTLTPASTRQCTCTYTKSPFALTHLNVWPEYPCWNR